MGRRLGEIFNNPYYSFDNIVVWDIWQIGVRFSKKCIGAIFMQKPNNRSSRFFESAIT
jgi:hypothetical protein